MTHGTMAELGQDLQQNLQDGWQEKSWTRRQNWDGFNLHGLFKLIRFSPGSGKLFP